MSNKKMNLLNQHESTDHTTVATTSTAQMEVWQGQFGREYTDRNTLDADALDALYQKNFGLTRTAINQEFLGAIRKQSSFLEVGCNTGNQLLLLQRMGYANLSGLELQPYALELARSRTRNIPLAQGSALAIPHGDDSFDVVFTSGVLIHIAPEDLARAMDEIHRCARAYIWGMEYYAQEVTEVNYRDHNGLLWKMDYKQRYLERFEDLELVRELHIPYLEGSNVDTMFLLKKKH
ncbi:MAG TPA: pseudaminic acid biosynthesis-associated methylase [Candidatus Sulfotelmatobacter sp.]|nr:pseudaminic acid biosynthesis-associated methylase [Candidatus Sulfotelmatobacter sp.]